MFRSLLYHKNVREFLVQDVLYLQEHEKHFQEQKQLDPIIPEQANHLIQSSVQRDDFRFC